MRIFSKEAAILLAESKRLIRERRDIIDWPRREYEKEMKELEWERKKSLAKAANKRRTEGERTVLLVLIILSSLGFLITWWLR